MIRVRDSAFLQRIVDEVIDFPIYGFDAGDLVSNSVVLAVDDDVAIFEPMNGSYRGHYLFKSRGKAAIAVAKAFIKELFDNYSATTIYGLTPCDNKAALWMNRRLGFKSGGIIPCPEVGDLELFTLHTKDFV